MAIPLITSFPSASAMQFFADVASKALRFNFLGQGLYFFGFGAKECLFDRVVSKEKIENQFLKGTTSKIVDTVTIFFDSFSDPVNYPYVHGGLFLATGTCLGLQGLQALDLIELGALAAPINTAAMISFALAKITSLQHNVQRFLDAQDIADPTVALQQKTSSVLGIMKSIGYLLMLLAPCLGAPIALAIVFGGIGLLTGCIKILYDFFVPN